MGDDLIRVAVRIRPLVPSEIEKGCQECLNVVPGEHQIQIRPTDKAFTFNYVFDSDIGQAEFYETAIQKMITHIFQGYNVTILAYGQTGSGKTHSMGTNYSETSENIGVIPRAVDDIFQTIKSQEEWDYKVTVAFMELYQEQLYDLLAQKQRSQCIVDIREDAKNIKIVGLTERPVLNAKETLQCLAEGSLCRATGATAMNSQSSRSHAIFTISVHQEKKNDPTNARTAKFQLVDLAGSERSKKTQATGERFKEGVNINKGLLALGNVISQLGECGTASYVGYRDSKLTRLLQDSLGGNSMTLMIACVSPADYNLDETLSTLRYADRARKIKNKPVINQDPQVAEINRLKKVIQDLKSSRLSQEIQGLVSCPPEHQELEEKNQLMQKKLRALTEKLSAHLIELVHMHERAELAEQSREKFKSAMVSISEECKELMDQFETSPEDTEGHQKKLESIRLKILDLQKDQKKTAEELVNHDLTSGSQSSTSPITEDDEGGDANETYDLDEKHEEHTLRQAQTIDQVQTITRELAIKEELVSKLLQNVNDEIDQSHAVRDMELEINKLQAEKEELQQQLNNVQNNKAASRLAETRRKKVQELEKKIADMTRKCLEQNKVIKQKEKSDQQIKNLANEIQSLKQTRVKLIRHMRTEADRFSKWKLSRERELSKLKEQDRKRVNQMAKLQTQYTKQQNVMKRKMEEAHSVNKRLKDALEKQRKVQQKRNEKTTNKDSIQSWVSQEMEVLLSTVDAECSLERLMQDRALLVNQLKGLRDKKDDYEPSVFQKQEGDLVEFIELRNTQITDLQQKILESDQENQANSRWQSLISIRDAKIALKSLFDITAEDRKKRYVMNCEIDDLKDEVEKLKNSIRKQEIREKEQKLIPLYNSPAVVKKDNKELLEQIEYYKNRCEQLEKEAMEKSMEHHSKKKKAPKPKSLLETPDYNAILLTDESIVDDDVENDPDWIKTPLYNRIQKLMNNTRNIPVENRGAMKRSSDGEIKCACKTKCSTRLCSCRKNDLACSNCNCNPENCQNKSEDNTRRTLFPDLSANDEVKRPRLNKTDQSSPESDANNESL
ncbi:chromosome-associated kinesin KIF4 [Belonocnema kinseyi]|uniref:chromosome-associated kinesin KIF4 n=1 Tax=Belonocnema kinseyi TaxID=2817044 RepID=UPI00143CD829|nr:chromosome-associated kinesin KIF4 [Belonocnema kinseyi]